MNITEQKKAAKNFKEKWKDKGYEKGQAQIFWIELLENVLGVDKPTEYIEFESQVLMDKSTGYIDGYISETKVLIEQKSITVNLRAGIRQSDGSLLSPFQQAKKYIVDLPYERHPRWVVTCNFKSFLIYDMNKPNSEPEEILLKDLDKEFYRLEFIINKENLKVKREFELSIKAGNLVGELYDLFLAEYNNPKDPNTLKSLNKLCVRIVFCLYAEDASIFGRKNAFHDYLEKFDVLHIRRALIELFKILNIPESERDPYLEDDLSQFPYVNGNLFEEDDIEIPQFTEEIKQTLLARASDNFNWSEISPTIFGAVFESTLNPETRRSGGMHYTSIENIHKVIDPLFFDELHDEYAKIKEYKNRKTRNEKLEQFQNKLASLTFLDPACGSGNFLTETYLSLRRLENDVISSITENQIVLDVGNIIKVDIHQFYGIEINDFAVSVATTALWIAESQMIKETEAIVNSKIEFLPLKEYNNIHEGNALHLNWNDIISSHNLNYIIGNPPFIGANNQTPENRNDMRIVFGKKFKQIGLLDYVTGWFIKAAKYLENTNTQAALVATSSITQGEQPGILWEELSKYNIIINFAYLPFSWTSDTSDAAAVYCTIVGFSNREYSRGTKLLFNDFQPIKVNFINGYLKNAPNIILKRRNKAFLNFPHIGVGNMAYDGGYLLLTEEEMQELIQKEPKAKKWIKKTIGAREFINNLNRYCLWLKDCPPNELRQMPYVLERVAKVKDARLNMKDKGAHKLAETPTLFREQINPKSALVIPKVSSERRRYIPMDIVDEDVIILDSLQLIENPSLLLFGILNSNVHMAWVRNFAGRLDNRLRYSAKIVYNNFPWPTSTEEKNKTIEKTAQEILNARKKYPNASLADLYDDLSMPMELRRAHQLNDIAVMKAYNFSTKMTESECVSMLMNLYENYKHKK